MQKASFLAILPLLALLTAWLATTAAGPVGCYLGAEDDLGCARGFQARERDARGSFRWTDGQATIRLAGAGYSQYAQVDLTLAAPRPANSPPATVVLQTGNLTLALPLTAGVRTYRLLLAGGPATAEVATLSLTSNSFTSDDRRQLGVQAYAARLRAIGVPGAPGGLPTLALLAVGLASLLLGKRQGWRLGASLAAGVVAIGALALLWAWLPLRVMPYLPALALLVGGLALLAGRVADSLQLLNQPPLLLAILGNALLDGLIVAQLVPRPGLVLVLVAQAGLTLAALLWYQRSHHAPLTFGQLVAVTLLVRLAGYAARLLAAQAASDPDTQLFYSYGQATLELGVPLVEYPSGALLSWMLLALPGSRELFTLLLPLFNLGCELVIVWGVWIVSSQQSAVSSQQSAVKQRPMTSDRQLATGDRQLATGDWQPPTGDWRLATGDRRLFPLFYALSPLLLPFWHGKYDPLPAALLVAGLALLANGRPGWGGAALGLGGSIKWVPWLALPFAGLGVLRGAGEEQRQETGDRRQETRRQGDKETEDRIRGTSRSRSLGFRVSGLGSRVLVFRLTLGVALAVAAASLPFALRDWPAFLAPYQIQGGRPIIGESIWFPLALLLKPELAGSIGSPWSAVRGAPLARELLVGVQLALLAGLGLLQLLLPANLRRALALAALAPALFLLLNRVFSPQYLLIITAAALAAGAALPIQRPLRLIGLLTLAQAANLLIWPNTMPWWLAASVVLFCCLIIALGDLVWQAVRVKGLTPGQGEADS